MKNTLDGWPNDADGDVLRRMRNSGFDFEKPVDIDFNVDFDARPPPAEFVEMLRAQFLNVTLHASDSREGGYVTFIVNAIITYELVMFVQSSVSRMASPFGGTCESWGVMQ